MFHVKHYEVKDFILINLPEYKALLLNDYMRSILEVNKKINLTRITDEESAQLLHIEDSLSVLEELNNAPSGKYIDLGSGGGFPGVPLAIASDRETVLIDSVKKKMTAVKGVLDGLSISNIETVSERIEDYSKDNVGEFSVVTARAVSSIPSLLELAAPLMRTGAHLILMKSREVDQFDSYKASELLGLEEIRSRDYLLSDNDTYRFVQVFEKKSEHRNDLPRRVGMAQKRPLVG